MGWKIKLNPRFGKSTLSHNKKQKLNILLGYLRVNICIWLILTEQKPRRFYDARDKGLHMTYWDVKAGEEIPEVPLLYSLEVNGLHSHFCSPGKATVQKPLDLITMIN